MSSRPRIAVGVSYFNNVKELPRLLDPVYKHVDLIIGIDGRYPSFEWPTNISNDGSTELLIEKYNAVVEINKSAVEQIDKRNQYLAIAENANMDWVLVLDTDDYLHPKWQDWKRFYSELAKLPKEQKLGNIWSWISPLWRKNWNLVEDNTWILYTRLIRPAEIRYDVSHWTYSAKGSNRFEMAETTIDGIRITSDSTLREVKYSNAGFEWAKKQMLEENTRFNTPRAKRMKYDFWLKAIKKTLANPSIEIIEDNTEEQITKSKS